MHTRCVYHLEVGGLVAESDLNTRSPLQAVLIRTDPDSTLFAIHADQSALIGLLRHLHGRGMVLISVTRER